MHNSFLHGCRCCRGFDFTTVFSARSLTAAYVFLVAVRLIRRVLALLLQVQQHVGVGGTGGVVVVVIIITSATTVIVVIVIVVGITGSTSSMRYLSRSHSSARNAGVFYE